MKAIAAALALAAITIYAAHPQTVHNVNNAAQEVQPW
jgi:hypothetical protein